MTTIELHMEMVAHDNAASGADSPRFQTYVEYGRRLMQIVATAQAQMIRRKPLGRMRAQTHHAQKTGRKAIDNESKTNII